MERIETTVAFLGPAGTFTHAAAREAFGEAAQYIEIATIDGVFDAIRRGEASFGVLPFENSTEGSVTHTVDALIEAGGTVVVQRELVLEVNHCLMSTVRDMTRIQRVYSHSQALAQCRRWLACTLANATLVPTSSTAAAARDALRDASGAAIAGRIAADLYGLRVLRDNVQDIAGNATRFVLLATEDSARTGDDKTAIAFAVHDGRGALLRVLEVFDRNAINLTRIESRPSRQRAWDYVFLVDVDGHREDDTVRAALDTLMAACPMLRILGSYPAWRPTAL